MAAAAGFICIGAGMKASATPSNPWWRFPRRCTAGQVAMS